MTAMAANTPRLHAPHSYTVRKAKAEDCATMLRMIEALAEYQGVRDRVSAKADAFLRDGFGIQPKFEALIAERGNLPVGLAIFQTCYLSWETSSVLQITDLYVDEVARGTGVGYKLVHEVAHIARDRGCAGLQLNMVHANPSRTSLDRMGFVHQDDLLHYRLDADGLRKIVEHDL